MKEMTREQLERLRLKALHTLEERQALDEYKRAESVWREESSGMWTASQIRSTPLSGLHRQRVDEKAAKCEELRLRWVKIHDDASEINEGRFPAMSYYEALRLVSRLAKELLEVERLLRKRMR